MYIEQEVREGEGEADVQRSDMHELKHAIALTKPLLYTVARRRARDHGCSLHALCPHAIHELKHAIALTKPVRITRFLLHFLLRFPSLVRATLRVCAIALKQELKHAIQHELINWGSGGGSAPRLWLYCAEPASSKA